MKIWAVWYEAHDEFGKLEIGCVDQVEAPDPATAVRLVEDELAEQGYMSWSVGREVNEQGEAQ